MCMFPPLLKDESIRFPFELLEKNACMKFGLGYTPALA